MRTFRTETKETKYETDIHYWCDWCQDEIEQPRMYEVNEFELSWETGRNYGTDGGCTETVSADLCIKCREKLFQYLRENGCQLQTEESDW